MHSATERRSGTTRQSWRIPSRAVAGVAIALIALLFALIPETAGAQDLPEYQLQRFRPAAGPADYLDTYSTGVGEPFEPNGGMYLDFADGPLRIATAEETGNQPVQSQMTASVLASMAVHNRAEVGLLLPSTLLQTSGDLEPVLQSDTPSTPSMSPQGLNDFRFSGKYQIRNLLTNQFGLAGILHVYLPTGTKDTFTGDDAIGGDLLVAGETWLWEGARLAVNLGYRYRNQPQLFRGATMGDEILWSVAGRVPLLVQNVDLLAELDGGVSVASDDFPGTLRQREYPIELRAASRIKLTPIWAFTVGLGGRIGDGIGAPNVRGFLGFGTQWVSGGNFSYDYDHDGIYGDADNCPKQPEDSDGFEDGDGCPDPDNDGDGVRDVDDECPNTPEGAEVDKDGCVEKDRDGDGITDAEDECPDTPEDFDDYQDDDGCPDPDNDGDGLTDLEDECPLESETENGYKDEDGCPDKPGETIRVVNEKIVINEKIHFDTGKAKIQNQSYSVLNELAAVLEENPAVKLVRIEGHTDNRGAEAYNRKLSQRRADSVRDYLINQGVSPNRLAAEGYGESKPIAPNDTAEGRRNNRRVEFDILRRDED